MIARLLRRSPVGAGAEGETVSGAVVVLRDVGGDRVPRRHELAEQEDVADALPLQRVDQPLVSASL